jgi:hypothetical protein
MEAATFSGAGQLEIGRLRLAPGSHSSPRDGVCVVELASLLAGERFSDRPACVCRVIGGYLRSLNDRVSHAERQRLLPYAGRAVGSRTDRQLSRLRRDLCLIRAGATPGAGQLRRLAERLAMRFRIWIAVGGRQALRLDDGIGEYAARAVFARHGAEEAIRLLETLFELGESEAAPLADPVHRAPQAGVAAAVRELAGDAPAAQGENGGHRRNGNRHAGDLNGRYARNGHEEHVEDDRAEDGDPERETKRAENPHDLLSVP